MGTEQPLTHNLNSCNTNSLVVDLSGQGRSKLDPNVLSCMDAHTLILDNNNIIKLENLDEGTEIKQLSVASNRLVRMMGVSKLKELRWLNLPNNSIGYIEGLKDLVHLEWLNLAGNNLKVMDELNYCVALQYLDLSDNNISAIGDITKLSNLKALHLHGNTITSLRTVPVYFPQTLTIVTLAENEIRDLNEVSYLASLCNLEHLSIMGNPCVMTPSSAPGCDCRPYVLSWCQTVKVLDGCAVSKEEQLQAEWMRSQGKSRSFHPGQHEALMKYLTSVCPLDDNSVFQLTDNANVGRVLHKPRSAGVCSPAESLPAGTGQQIINNLSERSSVYQATDLHKEENMLQERFSPSLSLVLNKDSSYLASDDVQTDEEKLHGTQLSSESFFLPVASYSTCPSMHTDEHDDKTDHHTRHPFQPVKSSSKTSGGGKCGNTFYPIVPLPILSHTQSYPSPMFGQKRSEVEGSLCPSWNTNTKTTSENECWSGNEKSAAIAERDGVAECSVVSAAVKIQAWWRGHMTRLHNAEAKEMQAEVRLHRMQEHIIYLTSELQRVRKEQQQERLQRMVQEEAVKSLWSQLQSLIAWQNTVTEKMKDSTVSSSWPCPPVAGSENH
ncbi:centrosomal protein of 97 kDa [Engraulis encrasicolus]|uniref:centrosomal protein of 97 kDa n=1 Tax=Engraulis encrasicolus TaxID=184585 RepID=UPI002FD1996F